MQETPTTSQMQVTLVGHYGSDQRISQKAGFSSGRLEAADIERRIRFLIEHQHMTPFEVVHFDFDLELPIIVDRQLMTYRQRDAAIANSGRYGSTPREVFLPQEFYELEADDQMQFQMNIEISLAFYERMVQKYREKFGANRAREIFRNLLPQGQMTHRSIMFNLREMIHILEERTALDAQPEIQQLARMMFTAAFNANCCPITWKALFDFGRINRELVGAVESGS